MGLLDDLSDNDLRTLAAQVGSLIKSTSIQVESLPTAESVDNIKSLPATLFAGGVKKTVAVPISLLKGKDGGKGDAIEFTILGSFNTLAELQAAYPNGPEINGLFKVGSLLYVWTGSGFELINLDVFKAFELEQFTDVTFTGNNIAIDYSRTPYAKITLSGDSTIFNLVINNTKDGCFGKILVFQTGFKQISVVDNIKGTIDLPLNSGTVALLTYNRIGDVIYIHSNIVLGDVQYPVPQKISDLLLLYSDATACKVQWTAPYANNIYDKATQYDMRYSNSSVDANDTSVWNSLKKISGLPTPGDPGEIQTMTISGLTPNKEYYIYLKSIKSNYGVSYLSQASEPVYFKTIGADDTSKAYHISLTLQNIISQNRMDLGGMVDEEDKNVYLSDGYPDTRFRNFQTWFIADQYSRANMPFDIFIDLFKPYVLDRLYLYSNKISLSVYTMKNYGYAWQKAGEINITWDSYPYVDFNKVQARFIKISFDLFNVLERTYPDEPDGYEGPISFEDWNGTISEIRNILLFARPLSDMPEQIQPPVRDSSAKRSVDQFFCTNGHLYQQGRIHSMCSGKNVRLYIPQGWFVPLKPDNSAYWDTIDTSIFDVEHCGWVTDNNGTGQDMEDNLRDTFAKYGLKPFLAFSDGTTRPCVYDLVNQWRPLDSYWLPTAAWKPLPKKGIGGLEDYFAHTYDPSEYKTLSRLVYALAAKYGSNNALTNTSMLKDYTGRGLGVNLICGIEWGNEPDADWEGFQQFQRPEEIAAIASACSDGNGGTLTDESGGTFFGVKRADPNLLAIHPGYAGLKPGSYMSELLHWKSIRPNADIPVDLLNVHQYFSNTGNQHNGSTEAVQYAVPMDFELEITGNTARGFQKLVEFRNRYASNKEIWITECGFGEAGGRDSASGLECFTMKGRYIGDWLIPDVHRADIKGAYTVRTTMFLMYLGFNQINYYSTECEGNYFGAGRYDSGSGFEMFHWKDIADLTPGKRYDYIEQFETVYDRGGFSCMGMFGTLLSNGAYPISRAYWHIATMRNRLKDYIYTGRKYMDNNKIMIFCFKKLNEDKGAYVVWYNDIENTGVANVEITVPEGVTAVKKVTTYVPEIPSPEDVPSNVGFDLNRTGLACARHEIYKNGEWVIDQLINNTGNYAQGVANYPDNPQEGDEVVVLPTLSENPYFPIVGAVQAKASAAGNTIQANQYEYIPQNQTVPVVAYSPALAWRQVHAVCDYIDHTAEGHHGTQGDEVELSVVRGAVITNVSEMPQYLLFDGVPDPDYRSEISELSSVTISSSSVELWWNNNSVEDTAYQIFVSDLPESGFTILKEVASGIENMALISGLTPDTTYYFRIRPINGDKLGTLSESISAKTYSELPAPTSLSLTNRTATSISIAWEYTGEDLSDFSHYAIYRAGSNDSYSQISTVTDRTIKVYADSGLSVGATYKYKVRAVGLNGMSDYSNILETRTMLPEESSPSVKTAQTDKLGNKITLTFDLAIAETTDKTGFTLTENGNARLISSVKVNTANAKELILYVPEDSLADYDQKLPLYISYSGGTIQSTYGVALAAFSKKIINVIGNYTDLEATFKVNLTKETNTMPTDVAWNNATWNAEQENRSITLKDTDERDSTVVFSSVKNDSYSFGYNEATHGTCSFIDIPYEVYRTGWDVKNYIPARLVLSGLNAEHRYTIRAYASQEGGEKYCTMKSGSSISNTTNNHDTTDNAYMVLEDITPVSGSIPLDFYTPATNSSVLNFLIIEEYRSNDEPANTDVFLREPTIIEAVDGVVLTQAITVHLNVIGTPTHYRISEIEDFTGAAWVTLTGMDVPFNLSSGFGVKTIYVQVKNQYGESNIRSIQVEYKDGYVAITLNSIYINDDSASTTSPNVTLFASYLGTPTHYRIGETADLSGAAWIAWPSNSVIPYVLSEGYGIKTVYMQLKDSLNTSAIKADVITYTDITPPEEEYKIILSFGSDWWNNVYTETYNSEIINITPAYVDPDKSDEDLKDKNNTVRGKLVRSSANFPSENYYPISVRGYGVNPGGLDDSGVYPAKYIKYNVSGDSGIILSSTMKGLQRFTNLAAGAYKVKFLISTDYDVLSADYSKYKYSANDVESDINFNPKNNMTNFLEINNVVVSSSGVLDIKLWNTSGENEKPGYNLIEIIKLS